MDWFDSTEQAVSSSRIAADRAAQTDGDSHMPPTGPYDGPDPSPESEAFLELFEPVIMMAQAGQVIRADTLQDIADATVELIEHIVEDRNDLSWTVEEMKNG